MLDLEGPPAGIASPQQFELLEPLAQLQPAGAQLCRATASYVNKDACFRVKDRSYERQYAQLYFARLMNMTPVMQARVASAWPGTELAKILDVGSRGEGLTLAVIGTLFKSQQLKPSVLDQYSKDRGLRAALGAASFCSDDDSLVLEDEGARMALQGACLPVQSLVTGVVVAVRGVYEPGGDFVVQDLLFADMAPQVVPRPMPEVDKYVALVSGFKLSSSGTDRLLVQMALDLLAGVLGSSADAELASRVVRLVVAGGSVGALDAIAQANQYSKQHLAMQPIKDLDIFLGEAVQSLPVDIMPGAEDPTNVALPQQPLHRCLLPFAGSAANLVRATNPHAFDLDGISFLGTSGQPLDDMAKYSRHADRLSLMEACARWRHLAPTAPDTLTTYPFTDNDPFVMHSTPHVMFAGNQPRFSTSLVPGADGQAVRLITLPSFSQTGCLVLLNLRTLACHPLYFESPGSGDGLSASKTVDSAVPMAA